MGLKEGDAKLCNIREQIIEDLASGLTIQFEVKKGLRDGKIVDETVMRLFGDKLPYGNREIVFGKNGEETAAGTYAGGLCKPTWQTRID